MVTVKSYIDLEQSRKLAEILPLESSDMFFSGWVYPKELHLPTFSKTSTKDSIPCWSLAALLDVLPDTITSNDGIAFKLNIKKSIIEYSNPSLYLIYKSVKADNTIDACYEMIIKLHELNLL